MDTSHVAPFLPKESRRSKAHVILAFCKETRPEKPGPWTQLMNCVFRFCPSPSQQPGFVLVFLFIVGLTLRSFGDDFDFFPRLLKRIQDKDSLNHQCRRATFI